MNGPLKWAGISLLNLLWGTIVFVLGTIVMFPDDTLKQRLVWEIERNTPLDAGLDDVGIGLGTVGLTNLVLKPQNPAAMGGFEGTILQADRLRIRASAAKAMQQQIDVDLDGVVFGGTLQTEFEVSEGDNVRSVVQLQDFDLARLELQAEAWSAELRGLMDVDADLAFSLTDHQEGEGTLAVEFDGLIVEKVLGMELDAAFNRALLRGELEGDTFTINVGEFLSEQVEAEIGGRITRQPALMSSRLALTVRFKLNEGFDSILRLQQGSNARHRSEEGWWHYRVSGQLGRPRFVPDNNAVRRGRQAGNGSQTAREDSSSSARRARSRDVPSGDDGGNDVLQQATRERSPQQRTTRSSEERRADLEASRERARERRAERRRLREERNNRRAGSATRRDPRAANQDQDDEEFDEQLDYPRQIAEIPDFDEFLDEGDEDDEDYEDDPNVD